MDIKNNFAGRLKLLREENNLSQTQLAKALGVSRVSISYYENSERTADIEFLYKVSNFFNVTTDYLIGVSDFKNPKNMMEFEKDINQFTNNLLAIDKTVLNQESLLNNLNNILDSTILKSYNDVIIEGTVKIIKNISDMKENFIDNMKKHVFQMLRDEFSNNFTRKKDYGEIYSDDELKEYENELSIAIKKYYGIVTSRDFYNSLEYGINISESTNEIVSKLSNYLINKSHAILNSHIPLISKIKTYENNIVFAELNNGMIVSCNLTFEIAKLDKKIKSLHVSDDGCYILDQDDIKIINNYILWLYGKNVETDIEVN